MKDSHNVLVYIWCFFVRVRHSYMNSLVANFIVSALFERTIQPTLVDLTHIGFLCSDFPGQL